MFSWGAAKELDLPDWLMLCRGARIRFIRVSRHVAACDVRPAGDDHARPRSATQSFASSFSKKASRCYNSRFILRHLRSEDMAVDIPFPDLRGSLPPVGYVRVLAITDRQFGKWRVMSEKSGLALKTPSQLVLF